MSIERHFKQNLLVCLLLFITTFLFPSPFIFADCNLLTEQDFQDAILGRIEFSQDKLSLMDMNQDQVIDVADLVEWVKTCSPSIPVASFESSSSNINEGDGTVRVRVNFSLPVTGVLKYSVSGSGTSDSDYQAIGAGISVDGLAAEIPITITDDMEFEQEETIVIELVLPEPLSYVPGVVQRHTVRITDNDSVWHGTLEVENLSTGFEMKIARSGSSYDAVIESDGSVGFSSGNWPVALDVGQNSFSAAIGPIQVDEQDTLIGTAFDRNIILKLGRPKPP